MDRLNYLSVLKVGYVYWRVKVKENETRIGRTLNLSKNKQGCDIQLVLACGEG